MRKFTTTGACVPSKHYMVDTTEKLIQIKHMVDEGSYFTINRARQYGKTTTIRLLKNILEDEYMYIRLSFESAGQSMFESTEGFCQTFLWHIEKSCKYTYPEEAGQWRDISITDFNLLGEHLSNKCKDKKIVLIIDEVDRAGSYKVFLMFLSMLREKFHDRDDGFGATFHSVILVGVTDIKNLKFKMEMEGSYIRKEGEGINASPWNIASNFNIDLSFNPFEISTMLKQYEDDHLTGMHILEISEEIYEYTSGYPFLVSRICQIIDDLNYNWTKKGVQDAVKNLLEEKNTLFDDMSKNLENYEELREFIRMVLIDGVAKPFTTLDVCVNFGVMFGYLKNINSQVAISNRTFEICIINYFILRDGRTSKQITGVIKGDVIRNGRFDMQLCLEKFARHYHEIFTDKDEVFLERHGRLLFLSYLKPLINGIGFYHIESETSNAKRMDIVVDYGNEQFIIELKRWYGGAAYQQAYDQLLGYMEAKDISEGYLLTYDFSKKKNRHEPKWVEMKGRRIFDVIV